MTKSITRQIVGIGGGGFSMEPHNLRLDRYILRLVDKVRPRVCFIPTASGDSEGYIKRFYDSFSDLPCEPAHLSLFKPNFADIRAEVLGQDVIYVGGGNTKNLLSLWREWGLDVILREAYEKGIVLAGISAGSICWFEIGISDSMPGILSELQCLGMLPWVNCPHVDSEVGRGAAFVAAVNKRHMPGIACPDGVAAHFVNEELHAVISSRPDRHAQVARIGDTGNVDFQEVIPRMLEGMSDSDSNLIGQLGFDRIKAKSYCIFAKESRIDFREWDYGVSVQQNLKGISQEFMKFIQRQGPSEREGFVIELPGPEFGDTIQNLSHATYLLLSELSSSDPANERCLDKAIDDPNWSFRFGGHTFYVISFAPCYREHNSRYGFGTAATYFVFQPEVAFDRMIPPGKISIPEPTRQKIRGAFEGAGMPYALSLTLSRFEAYKIVKPLELDQPPVRWWDER